MKHEKPDDFDTANKRLLLEDLMRLPDWSIES